jgi:Uma2 family endonuclease
MALTVKSLFDTPSTERMTARQYIDHPHSERKSDLINGVFIMAQPAAFVHECLLSLFVTTMGNFVSSKHLGKVMGSRLAYRLSEENVFQPDVSFIRADRVHLARTVYFPGPPDIAVEIVSPSSRHYDEVEKRVNYGRYGVQEYWLINPMDETAVFLARMDGEWVPIPADEGIVRSQVLDGFWLKLDWIFPPDGANRPSVLTIAQAQGIL